MKNQPILISCGAAKIETDGSPVQAWGLYTGGFYKAMLECAITVSPEVYIVSAGYGLLHISDMVETYDRRMDKERADFFKKMGICKFENYSHLLPKMYQRAITFNGNDLIPKESRKGMGYQIQWAKQYAKGRTPLVELETLKNGIRRELI